MDFSELVRTITRWVERAEAATGVSSRLIGAAAVLLGGWLLAVLLRLLVPRLVRRIERWVPASRRGALEEVVGPHGTGAVVGRMVSWLILLLAVMAATETLGLPVITAWLSGVASYVPKILVAVIIGILGIVSGRIARTALSRAAPWTRLMGGDQLGRIAQGAIVVATLIVAIEQLGIAVTFLTTGLVIVLGAVLGAAALAFGLGAREVVANVLAGHYVRQLYQVGQTVRIEKTQGRILRITPAAVVLEAAEGEVAVPARRFTDTGSVLVDRGG